MTLAILLALLVFLVGFYFYALFFNTKYLEGYQPRSRCPNMLIQKDSKFYLYNSKIAQVPGVNPIEFENLEDYTEFLDWQRSQGIRCPVLYLQATYDAQGNRVYKARPSVSDPQAGLPPFVTPTTTNSNSNSSMNDVSTLFNTDSSAAYPSALPTTTSSSAYHVGSTSLSIPTIKNQSSNISPDPMDPNWGGSEYTQSLVDKGYYKDNEVSIYVE